MSDTPHDYDDRDRAAEVQRDDEELMDQAGDDKEAAIVEGLVGMGRQADADEGGENPPFRWQPEDDKNGGNDAGNTAASR